MLCFSYSCSYNLGDVSTQDDSDMDILQCKREEKDSRRVELIQRIPLPLKRRMRNEVDKANCQSQVSRNICGAGGHSGGEKSHAVKDFFEQGLPTFV